MYSIEQLPKRMGAKPLTTLTNPHEQLNQNAPVELQEVLWNAITKLPQTFARPSGIAPEGSRALWTSLGETPERFMIGREFVHLHPRYDGSLHMVLPPDWADAAIDAGWAERHPLAGRFTPASTVMVFGPRNEDELAIVSLLVRKAYEYATGAIWLSSQGLPH